MPSNDFEQRMRARLSNAEFPASPEVWNRIARELKTIPWWKDKRWLAAAMLIVFAVIGVGGYLFHTYYDDNPAEVMTQSTTDFLKNPTTMLEGEDIADSKTQPTVAHEPIDQGMLAEATEPEIDPSVFYPVDTISQKVQFSPLSIASSQTDLPIESEGMDAFENKGEIQSLIIGNNPQETDQRPQVNSLSPIQIEDSVQPYLGYALINKSSMALMASGRPGHYRKSRFCISFYANPTLAWYTSTNFRVNQERIGAEAPAQDFDPEFTIQTVFYDITYSRTAIEAGIDLSYYVNDYWQIHAGAGIFRSGAHQLTGITLQPIWNDINNQQFERMQLQEVEVANTSFHTTQLLVPVAGSYTLNRGRGQWVVSLGLTLSTDISGEDFQTVRPGGSNEANSEDPLLTTQNTNLQANAQLHYQYSLRPGLSIYAGPVQSYGLTPLYETATGESIFLNRLGIRVGILFD